MEDLLAEFVAETREMLEALAGEIVAWEADPADRARLDAVFRFVHTVKGNCGFFDFPRLAALSHAAEDALSDVRAGRREPEPRLVSAVLAIIDRIGAMADAIEAGEEFADGGDAALIAALSPATDGGRESPAEPLALVNGDAGPAVRQSGGARTIRLPVGLLDRVMSGVSDMAVARNLLARRLQDVSDPALDAQFNRLSALLDDVRDAMTRTRMQRIDTLFAGYPRMVRDLSGELGKQAAIEIESGAVEIDREMLELIRDPLVHILRNAIDHGIESPAERMAAGKNGTGIVTVSARQTGNVIRIAIADDGRGIDADRLVEKAVAAGIVAAEDAPRLSRQERYGLICEPGLSTRDHATAVSGRGVGMDVVRANIERFGGSLYIFSTLGSGTRFVIDVPLTLSIVPSLTVGAGGQKFAITRSYVEEIVRAGTDGADMADLCGVAHVTLRGRRVPCFSLRKILEIGDVPVEPEQLLVVLTLVGGELFALAVDEVFDHEELVIKPLAPAIMATGLYAGTTQMDDGSPVLMLDVAGMAREVGLLGQLKDKVTGRVPVAAPVAETPGAQVLLFVGLDGRRRALPMVAVNRVEQVPAAAIRLGAGSAQAVVGETLYPLAGVEGATLPEDTTVQLFRLGDGRSEMTYAFREMLGIVTAECELAGNDGDGLAAGVALVDGQPVELVDCLGLFARHGRAPAPARPQFCRLPSGDRWFQDFLRPLVEAAGYRVIGETDETEADIAIAAREAEGPVPQGARAIWLRATPEATPDMADTIYRYDREGLMAALRAASAGRSA
ncbi:MAG: chemotaxis protein CheA [Novosphingobium sp.]|nr:chemotaxis protein CheA [Novosphingobium sp.]